VGRSRRTAEGGGAQRPGPSPPSKHSRSPGRRSSKSEPPREGRRRTRRAKSGSIVHRGRGGDASPLQAFPGWLHRR
jgi:hypothetical protein